MTVLQCHRIERSTMQLLQARVTQLRWQGAIERVGRPDVARSKIALFRAEVAELGRHRAA